MAISKKSWLGVARESTPGTAITTPTLYVPTKSIMKAMKKREFMNEERGTRDANYDVVDTIRWSTWDLKGPWYNDAHVYFLLGALGGLSSAQQGSTSVYKHTLTLADIPPSLTLMKSFDARTYYSPYCVVEKFSIKLSSAEKTIEFDSSGQGIWPSIKTSPPTPTFSTVKPFAGYLPTITLASGVSTDIDELTINFEQKILLWNPADGTADWATAYFGERKATVDFTARFDNDTLYQNYFKNGLNDTLTFDIQSVALNKGYTVSLGSPTAGTFNLTYNGQTTTNLVYNAVGSSVGTALNNLSSLGAGAVTVTGTNGGPYTVIFNNAAQITDGLALTGSGAGLTGGTFSITPQTVYNQELNIALPVISYDSMEHDLGKENVLIKAKATALAQASGLINAFVMNTITGYTV